MLRDSSILHKATVKHLSTIDVELVIDHTCLVLMASAEILDGVLLCGCHCYDGREEMQPHGSEYLRGQREPKVGGQLLRYRAIVGTRSDVILPVVQHELFRSRCDLEGQLRTNSLSRSLPRARTDIDLRTSRNVFSHRSFVLQMHSVVPCMIGIRLNILR